MAWSRQELVDWVQARIDEISPLDQSATIPQLIIERELDESALQVSRKAKKQLVYPAGVSRASHTCFLSSTKETVPTLRSVIIPLPSTFLRFLRVQLKNWNMPMDDLVSVDTNMYRHQYNRYQTATIGRPSAAIIPFNMTVTEYDATVGVAANVVTHYTQAIELFPAPSSTVGLATSARGTTFATGDGITIAAAAAKGLLTVFNSDADTALVTDMIVVEKTPAEGMPDSLIDPIVWLAAGRCLTNLRMGDLARAANEQYQFVLDQLLVGMKGEEVVVNKGK